MLVPLVVLRPSSSSSHAIEKSSFLAGLSGPTNASANLAVAAEYRLRYADEKGDFAAEEGDFIFCGEMMPSTSRMRRLAGLYMPTSPGECGRLFGRDDGLAPKMLVLIYLGCGATNRSRGISRSGARLDAEGRETDMLACTTVCVCSCWPVS